MTKHVSVVAFEMANRAFGEHRASVHKGRAVGYGTWCPDCDKLTVSLVSAAGDQHDQAKDWTWS